MVQWRIGQMSLCDGFWAREVGHLWHSLDARGRSALIGKIAKLLGPQAVEKVHRRLIAPNKKEPADRFAARQAFATW